MSHKNIKERCSLFRFLDINRTKFLLFADFILFLASLFWLIDWTPFDSVSAYNKTALALQKLEKVSTIIRKTKSKPVKNDDGSILLPDQESADAIINFARENVGSSMSLAWNDLCCVRYHSLKLPPDAGGLVSFRVLDVFSQTENGDVESKFTHIAMQNEVNGWLKNLHQRNLTFFIGCLLLSGFSLQLAFRVYDLFFECKTK